MSKWLLPTNEAGALWPQVTKQPLATRVHGVRNDNEARAVAQRYSGEISKFLQAQSGNRAASGLQIYKTHARPLPELQLAYTYNHGLEYLDVTIATGEGVGTKPEDEDFWDFALVEVVLPDGYFDDNALQFACYAHMTSPNEAPLDQTSVWPVAGVATNILTRTTPDRIINAADSASNIIDQSSTPSETAAASFTVDLRSSRGGAATLDVYGYLDVQDERIPPPVFLTNSGEPISTTEPLEDSGGHILSDISDYDLVLTDDASGLDLTQVGGSVLVTGGELPFIWYQYTTGDYDHGNPNGWPDFSGRSRYVTFNDGTVLRYALTPPVRFDKVAGTYTFTDSGSQFYNQYYGHVATEPDPLNPTSNHQTSVYPWWRHWAVKNAPGYQPGYSGPNPAPAKAQITLFKGTPPFKAVKHQHETRWTDASGNPVQAMIVSDTKIQIASGDHQPPGYVFTNHLSDFLTLPKIGSVTLDTRRIIKGREGVLAIASWNNG